MRHFCTLSDKNFLAKGIALLMSLRKHYSEEFKLHYLALDMETYDILEELSFPEIEIDSLTTLETKNPELAGARANRPYNEYCWTLASWYANHLVNLPKVLALGAKEDPIDSMTYVDSDLYFYQDPKIIFDEIGEKSVGVIAHRHNSVGDRDGAYNVGLIYFKNDTVGRECLNWWMDAVLNKKYPHLQTCGDQKYLEEFIPRFGADNVCVADKTFGHGAPWNFRLYGYDKIGEEKIVWGDKEQLLVFNHFSRFSYDIAQNSMSFTTGQYRDHTMNYQVFSIQAVFNFYREYFEQLKDIHLTLLAPKAPTVITRKIKIAFGMIILNGDYVLKQCLESVYPFAHQLLIAEGPVEYWRQKGLNTSNDKTNEILHSFPDPDRKINIVHGQFAEKDDQCRAYMPFLKSDADYLINLDSDELYKPEDMETIIKLLYDEKYTSVGIKPYSFYGGFDRYVGGFEEERDQFQRIFKIYPGSTWLGHRPPRVMHDKNRTDILAPRHLDSDTLYDKFGVRMYHYSYVFPRQVHSKEAYYSSLAQGKFIEDYFKRVYISWTTGTEKDREIIEGQFQGVHEYKPEYRRPAFTKPFEGEHPKIIQDSMTELKKEYDRQFNQYMTYGKF
jgi:hypothetical protein